MTAGRSDLPTGTVTFLFTDVEGSTALLHELGAERYADALAEHRRVLREAFAAHGGVEVDTQGDAFFYAFPTAPGALAAAASGLDELAGGPISVRLGVHTGTPHLTAEGYVGEDVHRAARIAACGHGGQALVSAATAVLTGTDGLRDLGEHRLKDLSAPVRIFQVGAEDFPPLKSLHQTNLPIAATSFLGRERELTEVLGLLFQEDVRLLTLTGPGGTGKTRLAAQAAGLSADRFPDGVWWVPLAPLRDPRLVLETAGQALGARNGLAEHVGDKRLLLLFDNFEHVVEAAGEVADVLASCPGLEVLATSREPLRLTGEHEYPVPPFAHEEGVGFFLARARAVRPGFVPDESVSEICRRVDDLPLALELAAARVKALSSAQILERLEHRLPLLTGGARDLPERQRTLRATISWSYDLLAPDEQRLFRRLSVFSGGCALEAAEAVCDADLDGLQSLVDKSLLRHSDERYWMLETLREFASERLEKSDEAESLRRRHAEHFLVLADEAELHLRGDSPDWANRLERENDNLRAALDWLDAAGEDERLLRMAGALSRFWYLHGHVAEGRRRLDVALARSAQPTRDRAVALSGASVMSLNLGDGATARRQAEEAQRLNEELGDAWGAAYASLMVANCVAESGDTAAAKPLLEQSLHAFRDLDDEHYALIARTNLAWVTGDLGDVEGERLLAEENLRAARALGVERLASHALGQLGILACYDGRIAEAAELLRDAIEIEHAHGDVLQLGVDLGRMAAVLAQAGRSPQAARLLAASVALTEKLGASVPSWAAERIAETHDALREQLGDASLEHELEAGRALSADEATDLAVRSAGDVLSTS